MIDDNTIVLCPVGRIDSLNAAAFEKEITDALKEHPDLPLVIDFDRLEYISSAGLRVLLLTTKLKSEKITVKNVSRDVYEILDTTGFTSMMNVERRMRSISIEGCEVIGSGATSTVYRIDPETIVKVYNIPDALEMIKKEQKRARHAFMKGIPTAISYDAVKVGDRYGAVFELLNARTFVDLLNSEPERTDELVRMHVEVMDKIHSIEAGPGELPDCREIYLDYLEEIGDAIPRDLRDQLEELFRDMPRDLHLIHGDIHMKNVMLCEGEARMIDMETLSTGAPVFDLADLFIAYHTFNEDEPGNSKRIIGIDKDKCAELFEKTLALCLKDLEKEEFQRQKRLIMIIGYVRFLYLVAVMRLGGEDLIGIRIRHTIRHLQKLLAVTDSGRTLS